MQQRSEEVLNAWLKLTTTVNNERMVTVMPYNEQLICGLLYQNQKSLEPRQLTATDLCSSTKMLKSQMTRTLNDLEQKDYIVRTRSKEDRRKIYITFNMDHAETYEREHEKVLSFINAMLDKIGYWRASEIAKLFLTLSNMAEEVLQ